jgi:uncharacterized membrane protein
MSSAPAAPLAPHSAASAQAQPSPRTQRLRAVVATCLLALVALGLAWELWLAPLPGGTGALALKVVPLTLAVAGVLRHRLYTYRWLSLLVWAYAAEGLLRATSETGLSAALAVVETLLSVLLFAACAAYVRGRLATAPSTTAGGAEAHGDG